MEVGDPQHSAHAPPRGGKQGSRRSQLCVSVVVIIRPGRGQRVEMLKGPRQWSSFCFMPWLPPEKDASSGAGWTAFSPWLLKGPTQHSGEDPAATLQSRSRGFPEFRGLPRPDPEPGTI